VKEVITFDHSLVLTVCNGSQKVQCRVRRIPFSNSSILADVFPPNGVMLDIHTTSSLIGTRDSNMSLEALGVKEEASNGLLTLYVVPRYADVNWAKIGKDAIFSFNKACIATFA